MKQMVKLEEKRTDEMKKKNDKKRKKRQKKKKKTNKKKKMEINREKLEKIEEKIGKTTKTPVTNKMEQYKKIICIKKRRWWFWFVHSIE